MHEKIMFIMLYKVVLSFKSVNETLVCDHSNESYWVVLSCGIVYYAVQGGFNFKSVDETLVCGYSKESYWAVLSCRVVYYAVQDGSNVKSMDQIQACDHAAKRYLFRIMPYQHLLALNTDKAYIVCSTLYTKG